MWVGGRKEKEDFIIKLDSEMCHRFSWQKTWPWESLGLSSFCDINNPTFSPMTFLLKGMGASLWVSHHGLQGSPGVTSLILSFQVESRKLSFRDLPMASRQSRPQFKTSEFNVRSLPQKMQPKEQ